MPLLPPATLGASRSAQQVLRFAYGERENSLQCALTVTPQSISLIGFNGLGLRLFSLRYDGVKVSGERAPGVPEQVDPQRILADVQLALWPLAALQEKAAGTAWIISEPFAGTRRVRRGDKLIAEIHYADADAHYDPWNGRLWLANFEFGYSVNVSSQILE